MKSKLIYAAAVVKTLAQLAIKGAGKKAATKRAKKRAAKPAESEFLNAPTADQAHSPGHRKMNLKVKPDSSSAIPRARKTKNPRPPLANRRIITGAAIGKTGRVTVER